MSATPSLSEVSCHRTRSQAVHRPFGEAFKAARRTGVRSLKFMTLASTGASLSAGRVGYRNRPARSIDPRHTVQRSALRACIDTALASKASSGLHSASSGVCPATRHAPLPLAEPRRDHHELDRLNADPRAIRFAACWLLARGFQRLCAGATETTRNWRPLRGQHAAADLRGSAALDRRRRDSASVFAGYAPRVFGLNDWRAAAVRCSRRAGRDEIHTPGSCPSVGPRADWDRAHLAR